MTLTPNWQVRRTGGILPPGFTKRFADDGSHGTTYFMGIPIGDFDVVAADADGDGDASSDASDQAVELRYRVWPVVDVLAREPRDGESIESTGNVSVGGRRLRFCRFRLER